MDTVIEKTLRRRGHSSTTQRQICTYLEFILTESHRMNTKLLTLLLVVAVVGLLAANTAEAKFEKFEYEHSGKRYKCKCKVKQIKSKFAQNSKSLRQVSAFCFRCQSSRARRASLQGRTPYRLPCESAEIRRIQSLLGLPTTLVVFFNPMVFAWFAIVSIHR